MPNTQALTKYPLQEYAQTSHNHERDGLIQLNDDLQDVIRLLALNHDEAELRLERIAQLGAMRESIKNYLSDSA